MEAEEDQGGTLLWNFHFLGRLHDDGNIGVCH